MKKIIVIIILVAIGTFAWWLIEPLLGDDVVNEELKVSERNISDNNEEVFNNIIESESSEEKVDVVTEEPRIEDPLPPAPEPEIIVTEQKVYSGNFKDADPSHRASGQVYIEGNNLSIANLNSTNVPDGFVYLSTDTNASDFISLGRLKGNVGNQNYSVPDGVDLEKYNQVLIWCKAFSILVGSAEIN